MNSKSCLASIGRAAGVALLLLATGCASAIAPPAQIPRAEVRGIELELRAQRARIEDMAALSNAAYDCAGAAAKDPRITCHTAHVDLFGGFDAVYLIRTDDAAREQVIAIRGSYLLDDWLTDALIAQARDSYLGGDISSHSGFQKVAHAVFNDIVERDRPLLDPKKYRITATGHSLGGATALLLALYMYSSEQVDYRVSGVYTFGQPKVFGNAGAAAFPFFSRRVIRVINCDDLVPIVPTVDVEVNKWFHYNHRLDDYQHMGQSLLLMNGSRVWMSGDVDFERDFAANVSNWLRAVTHKQDVGHQMPQYFARLSNLAQVRPSLPVSAAGPCGPADAPRIASAGKVAER